MSKYILSTMTSSVAYTTYDKAGDLPVERDKVYIAGGRGIASVRSGFGEQTNNSQGQPMWTAQGMVTPVTDAQLEILEKHPVFIKHQARGLVRILDKDLRGNHKAVAKEAASMETDDFAPMTRERLSVKVKVSTAALRQEDEFRI